MMSLELFITAAERLTNNFRAFVNILGNMSVMMLGPLVHIVNIFFSFTMYVCAQPPKSNICLKDLGGFSI